MIRRKNFSNMDPALIPVDTEYRECNFARSNPDMTGPQPVGIRLFPGDDTPRTFIDCNLMNCEVPPGSTVQGGLTVIKETGVFDRDETITIDNVVKHTRRFNKGIVHGRYVNGVPEYKQTPEEQPE